MYHVKYLIGVTVQKKKIIILIVDLRPPSMLNALDRIPCFHFGINRRWFQDRGSPLASGMLLQS